MSIFTFGRRRTTRDTSFSSVAEMREPVGPSQFAVVEEALTAERCPLAACEAVGREMALDGASISEALSGLQEIWTLTAGGHPTFEATQAFATAWGETVQSAANSISCEDPLTGMASAAHLRAELVALQSRDVGRTPPPAHALVVIDVSLDPPLGEGVPLVGAANRPFERALRLVRVREQAVMVFASGQTVARVGAARVVVLVERDEHLGRRVALLRRLVEGPSRIWIEGLPANPLARDVLVDELSRR